MIKKRGIPYIVVTICCVCAIVTAISSANAITHEFKNSLEPSFMSFIMGAHIISIIVWAIYMYGCSRAEKVGKVHAVIAVIVLSSTIFATTMLYSIADFTVHPENYGMDDLSENSVSSESVNEISGNNVSVNISE